MNNFVFPVNYSHERISFTDDFNEGTEQIKENLIQKMNELLDNFVWNCDPIDHIEGQTFLQLTKFLQGTIVQEKHIFGAKGECSQTCSHANDINVTPKRSQQCFKTYGGVGSCIDSDYDYTYSECNGKVYNCENIHAVS